MSPRRLRLLKIAALLTPILLLVLLLKAYGQPVRKFVREVVISLQFTILTDGPFEFVVKDGYRDKWARERIPPFVAMMTERLGFTTLPAGTTVRIYLLETEADLRSWGEIAQHPDPSGNGGFFRPPAEIAVLVRDEERDRTALYHELTHLFFEWNGPQAEWSPWLAEGMAATLAQSKPDRPGGVDPAALRAVDANDLPALADVLSPDAAAGDPRFRHAAHLLVFFLLETRPRELKAYRENERGPGPARPEDFRNHFGDLAPLEEEWKAFVRRLPR